MSQHWNEADIPDQSGRTVLITGASSGIGWEAARALARKGAHVILACRSESKGQESIAHIGEHQPTGTTELLLMDLADLDSVAAGVEKLRANHDRIDVLINNAGVMATPNQRTKQGFEMQFGTNHLGHFALTGQIIDLLTGTAGSRVVNISSQGHRMGRMRWDDLQWEKKYSAWPAYGQSKLANLLFTYELQRRLEAANVPTIAVAAHPGYARTHLGHEKAEGIVGWISHHGRPLVDRFFSQTAAMGALPTLRAGFDPGVKGGDYYGPSGFGEQRGFPKKVDSNKRSKNVDDAKRLWTESEKLTGITYTF